MAAVANNVGVGVGYIPNNNRKAPRVRYCGGCRKAMVNKFFNYF